MKSKKTIGWIVLALVLVAMLVTAGVFLMASTVPAGYKPYQLTQQERKQAAIDFVNRHGAKIASKIRVDETFKHELKEDELNYYLASLEEIAFLKPRKKGELKKSGGVYEAMDKAGLADPVVTMNDGKLTFMVRTKETNKVVSLVFGFDISDDKQLTVTLDAIKIGKMTIPQSMAEGTIAAIQGSLEKKDEISEADVQDLNGIIAVLITAINDKPLPTVIRFNKDRIREIRDLTFQNGKMEITIVPVDPEDYAKMQAAVK